MYPEVTPEITDRFAGGKKGAKLPQPWSRENQWETRWEAEGGKFGVYVSGHCLFVKFVFFPPLNRTPELAELILLSFFAQNLLKLGILSSSNEATIWIHMMPPGASINQSINPSICHHKSYIRLRRCCAFLWPKMSTWISEAEAPKPVFASVAEKGWSFYMMIWNTEVQRWHSRLVG